MQILILRTTLRSLTKVRTSRTLHLRTIIPMRQKRERVSDSISDVVVGEPIRTDRVIELDWFVEGFERGGEFEGVACAF